MEWFNNPWLALPAIIGAIISVIAVVAGLTYSWGDHLLKNGHFNWADYKKHFLYDAWNVFLEPAWGFFNPLGFAIIATPMVYCMVLMSVGMVPAFVVSNFFPTLWRVFKFALLRRKHW